MAEISGREGRDSGDSTDRPLTAAEKLAANQAERDAARATLRDLEPDPLADLLSGTREHSPGDRHRPDEQLGDHDTGDRQPGDRESVDKSPGDQENGDRRLHELQASDNREPPADQSAEPDGASHTETDDTGPATARGHVDVAEGERDDSAEAGDQRDPERLHRFGRKDAPREVRPSDFALEEGDEQTLVGPYRPTAADDDVHGASTYIDPFHEDVEVKGQYHRLPEEYEPPQESGLAIHADGKDVGGFEPWGHRTIYPTEQMSLSEFAQRVAELPWEYVGKKKEG